MRGFAFEGAIGNGDEVQIDTIAKDGAIVQVREVQNLTSNSTVRVTSRPHPVARRVGRGVTLIFKLVLLFLFLAAFAVVAYLILSHGSP